MHRPRLFKIDRCHTFTSSLTVQVASLQSQVTGLQHTAFTQQAQLERLNQEALRQGTQAAEGSLGNAEQHR